MQLRLACCASCFLPPLASRAKNATEAKQTQGSKNKAIATLGRQLLAIAFGEPATLVALLLAYLGVA
jgi:hypothetical protein